MWVFELHKPTTFAKCHHFLLPLRFVVVYIFFCCCFFFLLFTLSYNSFLFALVWSIVRERESEWESKRSWKTFSGVYQFLSDDFSAYIFFREAAVVISCILVSFILYRFNIYYIFRFNVVDIFFFRFVVVVAIFFCSCYLLLLVCCCFVCHIWH